MGWNHRLVKHSSKHGDWLQIHEVYYDSDGNVNGITKEAIEVLGEDVRGIELTLEKMKECLSKPILNYDDF